MEGIFNQYQPAEYQKSKTGAKSLRQHVNDKLLRTLAAAVAGEAATATFTCGGAVPIENCTSSESPKDGTIPAVELRWDSSSGSGGSKISFPLQQTGDDEQMLAKLIKDCQPATFGMGGRDVLDESYRKASKLDCTAFSTNFHPHDCSIVDSIRQVLLPSMTAGGEGIGIGPRGVKAELYKLNIYSNPSGIFHAHVDTPRGPLQFGSLVVCLPYAYQGGALLVEHRGQVVEFDWSSSPRSEIQWAAFYGDCKHQVLEVTGGHRITLTYNLYFTKVGDLARPVAKPECLALYRIVTDMLAQPGFMTKGGRLGFFCSHQYAHSQSSGRRSLPGSLKGVDLAIFSVFAALGLSVKLRPVIAKPNYPPGWGGLVMQRPEGGSAEGYDGIWPEAFISDEEKEQKEDKKTEGFNSNEKKEQEEAKKAKESSDDDDDDDDSSEDDGNFEGTVVGSGFHGQIFDQDLREETAWRALESVGRLWPFTIVSKILWMNEPAHQDFAFAHMAYGNQACLKWTFSAAAILVKIPKASERNLLAKANV